MTRKADLESIPKKVVEKLAEVVMDHLRLFKEAGFAPPSGEDFLFLASALSRVQDSKAQLSQDLWVLYELGDKRKGFFVEFGAGDGKTLSNTYLLETKYDWRGVLAEPNPSFRDRLGARRAALCFDCVSDRTGDTVSFNLTADPHLSTLETFSSTDMHAEARRSGQRIELQTISLNDLLKRHKAPPVIDYLSIDTEGSEFLILKALDFSRWSFGLITVEHNFGPTRNDIRSLLEAHGYRRKFEHLTRFDDWYVNDEALAKLRRKSGARSSGS